MKAFTTTPTVMGEAGELLDYLDRVLCVAAVRVRPGQANGTAPTFDATTNSPFNGIASGGALTFAHTAASGTTWLEVTVHLSTSTQWVTGINWDSGGTPQAMFQLGRFINSGNCAIEVWGLFNPTTGTKNVAVTLNATGIGEVHVESWIGVGSIRNLHGVTGSSVTPSVTIPSWDTLTVVVDHFTVKNTSAATASQTSRYNTTEANGGTRNGSQSAAGTGSNVTMSWTVTSGQWVAVAYELRPTDDRSYQCRQDVNGYQQNLTSTILAASADEVLIGFDDIFTALRIYVSTALVGGQTVGFKFWNHSAFTAVAGLSDGTSNLTLTGEHAVTFTNPGIYNAGTNPTGWEKSSYNGGPSLYYLQLTVSGNPSTAPIIKTLVVNWTVFDEAGNLGAATNGIRAVYKTIGEDGSTSTVYLDVDDGNAGAGTIGMTGTVNLYESWNAATHVGTNASGSALVVKGSAAGVTVRTVYCAMSRDGFHFVCFEGQVASQSLGGTTVQKINSYVPNDAWAWAIIGSATGTAADLIRVVASTATFAGHFIQRAYTGSGGGTALGAIPPAGIGDTNAANFYTYPNPSDGKLISRPLELTEGAKLRGSCNMFVMIPHVGTASMANGDVFTDANTGVKYTVVRVETNQSVSAGAPWIGMETPNT
ncbi:MAG TPA: hypothetical protein VFA62_08840 [Acidimicrobiia bacterium]|nr:hypothetical protein [Acidimicrobiia bacterium]